MTQKNIIVGVCAVVAVILVGYFFHPTTSFQDKNVYDLDPTPKNVTLSGTYECLPHLNTDGPQTTECAFGIKTDQGEHYAVDFGQIGNPDQFQFGKHVTAEGSVVIKEALSSDHWSKYNMKGVFTITKIIEPSGVEAKINIDVVCNEALAYMSFPDGKSADAFVKDCKEGKHPEVIEQYKANLNLEDGVEI